MSHRIWAAVLLVVLACGSPRPEPPARKLAASATPRWTAMPLYWGPPTPGLPTTPRPKPVVVAPRAAAVAPVTTVRTFAAPGEVAVLVARVFGPEAPTAMCVIHYESDFDPRAKTGSYWGLLQIGVETHKKLIADMGYSAVDMLSAEPNLRVGLKLRSGWSGWRGPWAAQRRRCGL